MVDIRNPILPNLRLLANIWTMSNKITVPNARVKVENFKKLKILTWVPWKQYKPVLSRPGKNQGFQKILKTFKDANVQQVFEFSED